MSLFESVVYKSLDAITFGRGVTRKIDGRSIKFPARWSRYYSKVYDPETCGFLDRNVKKGDTVLDIGGHIGLFAVITGRLVGRAGRVFTFEPTPFTRAVLKEVIELNGLTEMVEVRGEAVSSKRGETVFFDTGDTLSNANSLVKTERSKTEIPITLISVDEFVKDRGIKIDCMKIDVEGAELDVLIGARDTFLTHRPTARLGLHPQFIVQNGQTLKQIWNVLVDYKLKVIFDGSTVEKEWFCSRPDLFDVNLLPIQ